MSFLADISRPLRGLVYKVRRRKTFAMRRGFSRRQWWDRRRILDECDRLTRELVTHAVTATEYYGRLFRRLDLDPATLDFPEDWQMVPLLDKDILRNHYEEMISSSRHGKNSYVNHTGGSTGSPVRFLTDLTLFERMVAWMDLTYTWAGWRPGELRLNLWGGKHCTLPPTLWDRIRASLAGGYTIPVYEYTERELNQWWQVIRTMRPTIIYGYPSVLDDFARWLESEGVKPAGIKGVFSSAEVLYPRQRQLIESVFGCKVYNQYGSREAPCIAGECPEGEMHIFCDLNRVEFVDVDGDPNGDREIVVTPLYGRAQPLLRYRLGDMGRPKEGSCRCGRGYPLMELNVARSRDFLLSQSGSKIYPGFFTRLMDEQEWVRSFQFVQKAPARLELNLEVRVADRRAETRRRRLRRKILPLIEEKTGRLEDFQVRIVSEINRTRAGKHRFVVNEMEGEARG